eukprot:gene28326-35022_t
MLTGTETCSYTPGSSLPNFPNTTAGTFFSGAFTDHVVLQREPAKSAVYGVVIGATPSTIVSVTVAGDVAHTSYTVAAKVEVTNKAVPSGKYGRWKALLTPQAAGGNYTISVACTNCANTTSSTLYDVTYGDVWFCS